MLRDYEPEIEKLTLVPSEGGRFEVEVNGRLLFSKKSAGRHARAGEIQTLLRDYLKDRTL